MAIIRKCGWNPDVPDCRDHYKVSKPIRYESHIDLRDTKLLPPIWDQGELGSCVLHATLSAFDFCLGKERDPEWMPSRLFGYYNAREMEGSIDSDDGCQIRDAIKQLNRYGVCHEDLWPYNVDKFRERPTQNCYDQGLNNQLLQYSRVEQSELGIATCLTQGFPVCLGITLYDSFQSNEIANTGIIPMPKMSEHCIGGHAVLLVGQDLEKSLYIMRNSWGEGWGDKGCFYIPCEYILNSNLTDDLWCLQQVENGD